MQLSISGRHVKIGQAFSKHCEIILQEFNERHHLRPTEAQLILSKEGPFFRTDLTLHMGKRMTLRAHETGDDAKTSFANALTILTSRVRRQKKRLQDHHKNHDRHLETENRLSAFPYDLTEEELSRSRAEASMKGSPAIIAENNFQLKKLPIDQAVKLMDLEQVPIYFFRHQVHDRLNVLYRRTDGNIGWIDPVEH